MHRRPQFEPLARLAAAGCGLFGPWGSRWVGLSCRTRTPGPLVLRGCVYPAGCCCGGFAAGARLGWLRRWGLDWVRGLRLEWVRLSCATHARTSQLRWTSPPHFSFTKQSPPLRGGLPASAGWGRGGTRTQPSGSADARPLYANHIARRCTLLIFTKDPAPQDRRCGAYCASIYPYAPSQRTSSQPPRSSRTAAGLPAGMVNRGEAPASGAS